MESMLTRAYKEFNRGLLASARSHLHDDDLGQDLVSEVWLRVVENPVVPLTRDRLLEALHFVIREQTSVNDLLYYGSEYNGIEDASPSAEDCVLTASGEPEPEADPDQGEEELVLAA